MSQLMENDLFKAVTTYAAIVTLKMKVLGPLTSYFRLTIGSLDLCSLHPWFKAIGLTMNWISSCHHNNLENIIPFFFIGLLYALSGPELSSALLHFRIFTGARIIHSFVYILAFPQQSRGLSYLLGMLVTLSMAYNLLSKVFFL